MPGRDIINSLLRRISMVRRFLLVGSLLLLSTSGWANVLAASLCTHTAGAHACCMTKKAGKAKASSHHEMGMHGMESMERPRREAAPTSYPGALSLGKPTEDCPHCLGHSQTQAAAVASVAPGQSGQDGKTLAPAAIVPLAATASAFAPPITFRQHAPPGNTAPRHVLISVFRI